MKINLYSLLSSFSYFPNNTEKNNYFFSKKKYCIYPYNAFDKSNIFQSNSITINEIPIELLKKAEIYPLPKTNELEFMKLYLQKNNIPESVVIEEARKDSPRNSLLFPENIDDNFDVAFRIYTDIFFIKNKNGKNVQLFEDWFYFYRELQIPIAIEWCKENDIKYFTSTRRQLFNRFRRKTFSFTVPDTILQDIVNIIKKQ